LALLAAERQEEDGDWQRNGQLAIGVAALSAALESVRTPALSAAVVTETSILCNFHQW